VRLRPRRRRRHTRPRSGPAPREREAAQLRDYEQRRKRASDEAEAKLRAARRSELADFRASVAEADAEAREALQRLREHVAEELAAELERRRSSRELKRAGWPRHAESQNKGLQVIHALYCNVHVLTAQEKGWFPTNAEYYCYL
jgi:hypothetical protein